MDKPEDIPADAWKAIESLKEAHEGRQEQKHLQSIINYKDLKLTWKQLGKSLTEEQWLNLLSLFASLPITLDTGSNKALKQARRLAEEITHHAISLRDKIEQLRLLTNNHAIPTSPILSNLSALIAESSQENIDFLWWQDRNDKTEKPRFPEPGEIELKYQPKLADILNELANYSHSGALLPDNKVSTEQFSSHSLIDWVRHFDREFEAEGYNRFFPDGWILSPTHLSRFLTAVSTGGRPRVDRDDKFPGEISIALVNKARKEQKQ
jgi:hypothetical protein